MAISERNRRNYLAMGVLVSAWLGACSVLDSSPVVIYPMKDGSGVSVAFNDRTRGSNPREVVEEVNKLKPGSISDANSVACQVAIIEINGEEFLNKPPFTRQSDSGAIIVPEKCFGKSLEVSAFADGSVEIQEVTPVPVEPTEIVEVPELVPTQGVMEPRSAAESVDVGQELTWWQMLAVDAGILVGGTAVLTVAAAGLFKLVGMLPERRRVGMVVADRPYWGMTQTEFEAWRKRQNGQSGGGTANSEDFVWEDYGSQSQSRPASSSERPVNNPRAPVIDLRGITDKVEAFFAGIGIGVRMGAEYHSGSGDIEMKGKVTFAKPYNDPRVTPGYVNDGLTHATGYSSKAYGSGPGVRPRTVGVSIETKAANQKAQDVSKGEGVPEEPSLGLPSSD